MNLTKFIVVLSLSSDMTRARLTGLGANNNIQYARANAHPTPHLSFLASFVCVCRGVLGKRW